MPDSPRVWQRCDACGHRLPDDDASPVCPLCHGLLAIEHPTPDQSEVSLRTRFDARCCMTSPGAMRSGVWRFADIVHPSADAPVSYPEGNTPLLEREAVRRFAGCEGLLLKHEGMNPTGSFKDRGMTVGVTQAKRLGATAVACASTGNTSASLASYAALAGIPALVFVPAGQIALGKLTQTLAYGARTLLVRGDFDACLSLVRDSSSRLGIYLLNSINPWRLEGQKTIVLELLQQLRWESPDWIALPAGNLGNISAFGKALREAKAWGLISRIPRLLAVQAEGASPFYRSFRDGFAVRHRMKADTVATAIKIGDPASYDRAVTTVREADGIVTQVTDAEILEAKAAIDAAGAGCEPASAASVAGVRQLVREGVIRPEERVVAILTGHVLKDPGILQWYHQEASPPGPGANRPIEIEADVAAVERVLRGT
ncbi:MAG TPA: threonine synthase [Gemmatimonadaceae bacterium]|jgi:threonine synthase|nr:threonine synthase [Gemmatimonadaceae bacterium]